jgi:hypothetical protein
LFGTYSKDLTKLKENAHTAFDWNGHNMIDYLGSVEDVEIFYKRVLNVPMCTPKN